MAVLYLLHLNPERATINNINPELIHAYGAVNPFDSADAALGILFETKEATCLTKIPFQA